MFYRCCNSCLALPSYCWQCRMCQMQEHQDWGSASIIWHSDAISCRHHQQVSHTTSNRTAKLVASRLISELHRYSVRIWGRVQCKKADVVKSSNDACLSCWYESRSRHDGKDNRIARGLKPVNAQLEKPLHVSRAQIAVGPATVAKPLPSTHLQPMHARCTNIESDKTTSIQKVRRTEVVLSFGIGVWPRETSLGNAGPRFVSQTTIIFLV